MARWPIPSCGSPSPWPKKNRLEAREFNGTSPLVIKSLHNMIGLLEAERIRLENNIDDHVDRHPDLKVDLGLLRTIPGIGPVVSRVIVAMIRSRPFETESECAAFLGVIPQLKELGIFQGHSTLSKKGPPKVRAKLYMAAIVASQYNPGINVRKERLLKNGKDKMQAPGAAMQKLVHQCFGVLKHQTEYCLHAT